METPKISKLHEAVSTLNGSCNADEAYISLAVVETFCREMLTLLSDIASTGVLQNIPQVIQDRLTEFGVISHDDAHTTHIRVLTNARQALSGPMREHEFFRYHSFTQSLIDHDILASELIRSLLLWSSGGLSMDLLLGCIQEYQEKCPDCLAD